MNVSMIWRLVCKDLYFQRLTVLLYLLFGALGLFLFSRGTETTFYVGSVGLVFVLLALAVHMAIATILDERKQGTHAFLLSLPTTITELSAAKILANLLIFLVPWSCMSLGVLVAIQSDRLPGGLAPYVSIHLLEVLLFFCVYIATALVTNSMGWTVVAIVTCNLTLNFSLYFVAKFSAIEPYLEQNEPVWNQQVWCLLAIFAAAVPVVLALAFVVQSRKKDLLS